MAIWLPPPHFLKSADGALGVCRSERVRPRLAALALVGVLLGQTLVPCGLMLSSVHATELRLKKAAPGVAPKEQIPAWARDLEKRAAQQEGEQKLRLTQLQKAGKKAKKNGASEGDLDCLDCEVSLEPLDLSGVPTEKALRLAGGEDGPLYPMRKGDAQELTIKLDRLIKRMGVEGGLRGQLPPKDPRFAALKRARERSERANTINSLFGKAVKEWRGGDHSEAANLFSEYMDKYPQSPWSGEAAMHLGYAAKEEGRLADAVSMFEEILEKTSDEPNEKLRKAKRERKARGGVILDSEREADISKALEGASSFEAAVDKLDSAKESYDDDESFEIHMKAKQQLADIDIAMGHYDDASDKLLEIMEEDTDWHRRVWARKQLQRTNVLKQNGSLMMACGPQALGTMLVGLHKEGAAKKVEESVASNSQSFSMAELKTLAAQNGVQVRGFRADTNQLSELVLPAILHYDFGRDSRGDGKVSGHFVVLQGVDKQSEMVRIFDPLSKRATRLSYAQLKRQWSGKGLEVVKRNTRLVGASLSNQVLTGAVGSSTITDSDGNLGNRSVNASLGTGNGVDAPSFQINQASFNVYAEHTLLSYQPAHGPAVNVTAIYNSEDSRYQQVPSLGTTWILNYSSTANRTPNVVGFRMPDGSSRGYSRVFANGQYGTEFKGVKGDFNTVENISPTQSVLVFPDGTRWTYTRQAGYDSNFSLGLTKITDARGLSLTLNYFNDGTRRLSSIVDADNNVTTIEWHAGTATQAVAIKKITDPFGRSTMFNYTYARLRGITDAQGRLFSYDYENSENDIISIDGPKVNVGEGLWRIDRTRIPYDQDELVTITNPLGSKEGYAYDDSNGLWSHVTPNRYVEPFVQSSNWQTNRRFWGNALGQTVPIIVSYSDGTYTTYRYEFQQGLLDQITDRQGQITSFAYNDKGQVSEVTDPKNVKSYIEYDSNGFDPIRYIQPNPSRPLTVVAKTITYNNYRQPTTVTDVNGTTSFTYDTTWGVLLTTTDPQNRATRYSYDANGRLAVVDRSDAPVTGAFNWAMVSSFKYYPRGLVSEVTDAAGLKTSYEYNNLDKVTAVVHPDPNPNSTQRREEISYLNGELPYRVKDRFGRFSFAEYDSLKRVRKSYVQDAQSGASVGTTQMDYDLNGNLWQLSDTKGNLTRWSYDTLDRPTGKQYHDGTTESYTYQYQATGTVPTTRTGRLLYTTGTRGQSVYFSYDQNGNQTKIDYPNTPDVTMSYNALNDVSVIADGVGTHVMTYDDFGRLVSNRGPLTNDTQTYAYDELQRISTQTVERGASGGVQSQTYGYDALGRLTSLNANGDQGTGLTTYSYEGNTDRLRILTHPNGTKSDLRYDGIGRLQHVFNSANGNVAYNRYSSNYDARDVKINTVSHVGAVPDHTTFYTYDALDQLKQERVTGGVAGTAYTTNYNYDPMGNRLQVDNTSYAANGTSTVATTTSVPNNLNQLSSLTTTLSNGPTTSANLTYDNAGNLTQALSNNNTRTVYTYDDADRLSRIEQFNSANAPLSRSEFVYDYASRKAISREFNFANGAWTQTDEKRRVFDGLDVVQERNAANQVTAQLVRDGNIGGILSRTTADGAAFYGYDGNGNVTLLTNSAGQDVGHYRYDAFGQTLEVWGARGTENPYRFSTKELHGPSGLYDYGYRFYSPGLGRWMNRDPLGEEGGMNLYQFVSNSPINASDSYGLDVGWAQRPWDNDPGGYLAAIASKGFDTEDEAAAWAIRNKWDSSDAENKEYGGFILKDAKTGKYIPANPERGTRAAIDTGNLGKGGTLPSNAVGEWHTHHISDPGSEFFSQSDETRAVNIFLNKRDGSKPWSSYIGTPTSIRRLEPSKMIEKKYKYERTPVGELTRGDYVAPRKPKAK